MKKISEILFESVGKRKQSWEELAEVGYTKKGDLKIEKYCAIGAIGCENKTLKLDEYSPNSLQGDDEEHILKKAGIPNKSLKKDYIEWISDEAIEALAKHNPIDLREKLNLTELIVGLNDMCRWSFKKIGTEIKELEDRFVITYKWHSQFLDFSQKPSMMNH